MFIYFIPIFFQGQQQQKTEATVSPRELVDRDLNTMFQEIHQVRDKDRLEIEIG